MYKSISTDKLFYGTFTIFMIIFVFYVFSELSIKRLSLIQEKASPDQFSNYLNILMIGKIVAIITFSIAAYKMISKK
jgi:hypothetical protein